MTVFAGGIAVCDERRSDCAESVHMTGFVIMAQGLGLS
jgi:hypothetical protein